MVLSYSPIGQTLVALYQDRYALLEVGTLR